MPTTPPRTARSRRRQPATLRQRRLPSPAAVHPSIPSPGRSPRAKRVGRAGTPGTATAASHLSIPAIRLRSVPVLRYAGTPDDDEGTRIQNRGPTASPRGPGGGVGPGEVGTIVTGHRTSHSAPFRDPPARAPGTARVHAGQTVYVYRVTATRSTSFRSQRSLAEHRPRSRPPQRRPGPADDHAVDVCDPRGSCGRKLLVGPFRQSRAPDRQGGGACRGVSNRWLTVVVAMGLEIRKALVPSAAPAGTDLDRGLFALDPAHPMRGRPPLDDEFRGLLVEVCTTSAMSA